MISILKMLRPHQWLKNILLLFPPFFAGNIFMPSVMKAIVPSLFAFSLAASCSYIINDLIDREADRNHAIKKNRIIASSSIPVFLAIAIAVILYVFALLTASSVSRRFEWFIILYLFVSLSYSFFLKNYVIYDIFLISFGFLLRVLAGGEAFRIGVTNWLFLTVFTVALMLAAGKRLGELISLGNEASNHRKSFLYYTPSFLEGTLWFSAAASLITYAMYTVSHSSGLFYTVPLAAFGLLRYIFIVKQGKGDPTEALLGDGHILGTGVIWFLAIGTIIYLK
jgi:decaprenyl-phosphate phosphoribosyltransferase